MLIKKGLASNVLFVWDIINLLQQIPLSLMNLDIFVRIKALPVFLS